MLSLESLREFIRKYQTKETNVFREYIQHLFLSSLYQLPGSEKLLFKGGTALRIIYRSPRFSEDIDFTGQNIYTTTAIDELFISAMAQVEKLGVKMGFQEAKPTTGGYLGVIQYELYHHQGIMKFEVSLRRGKEKNKELTNVLGEYLQAYKIWHLEAKEIVGGKLAATLDRQKTRDYYDLYFILRHPELNKYLNKKILPEIKENLRESRINFKKELSVLLPVSHHMILKDFKNILLKEMIKYI